MNLFKLACKTCGSGGNVTVVMMPCKVCELNKNDLTPKRAIYCNVCKAYICEPHLNQPVERLKAALKNWLKQFDE